MAVASSAEVRLSVQDDIGHLRRSGDVPRYLSVGLPALTIGVILLLMLVAAVRLALLGQSPALSPQFLTIVHSERGPMELGTVALALIAVALGVHALVAGWGRAPPWLLGWVGVNALGALFFSGEEASWGQHLLGWETGGWFVENNDQQETNFHNTSSWLDQKPRLLLFLWCVIGSVIVPLVERKRGLFRADSRFYWIWPTRAAMLAGVAVLVVRIPEHLVDLSGTPLDSPLRAIFTPINLTEAQEFLYAVFILIFMVSLARRVAARWRMAPKD